MVVKCADIGHLAADIKTHQRWAFQLEEEFFRQVPLAALSIHVMKFLLALQPSLKALGFGSWHGSMLAVILPVPLSAVQDPTCTRAEASAKVHNQAHHKAQRRLCSAAQLFPVECIPSLLARPPSF